MSASIASGAFPGITTSAESTQEISIETRVPIAQEEADEAVVERLKSGDKEALGLLFDRHAHFVLSAGLRILRDLSEAEELVQDVFLYVFNKCATFDATKSYFRSWLIQIAYSRAFNKREYLTRRRFYDYCNIDEVMHSLRSNVCLENQTQLAEVKRICEEALAELTERQRRTLQLFFFQGLTLREISAQMDESLVQTSHHYYRGLEKLRAVLSSSQLLGKNGHAKGVK